MAVHGRIAMEEPSRAEGTIYKDESLSFRSLKKIVASQSAWAHHWHIVAISVAVAHNPASSILYEYACK